MKAFLACSAFTWIELLVVIATIAVLAAIFLPRLGSRPINPRLGRCFANQHQVALAFTLFSDEHSGKFPAQVSTNDGGALELTSDDNAARQFQALSSYIGDQPTLLYCPADQARHPAAHFSDLKNENISYFLNLDAALTNAASILTGDRFLETDGRLARAGNLTTTTNMTWSWASGFHLVHNQPEGIFSFGDGYAELIPGQVLNSRLQTPPNPDSRFCFP